MIYCDINGYYLYQMAPKFSDNFKVSIETSPKKYGQKILNKRRGKK